MNVLNFKDKKINIINFIIITALAIFSVLNLQDKNIVGSAFGVILAFTILVFDNEIKNYKDQDHDRKKMLINIFNHCGIYIIVYGLILFVFKTEIILIIKIMVIQIFLLIYSISRHFVSKTNYKKKVVFYILFFSILIAVGIYGLNEQMDFVDMILYSTASASLVSALFCNFFIKLYGK